MAFGLVMLAAIAVIWLLFMEGYLWKLILFCAGWFGIYALMRVYVAGSHKIAVVILDEPISWAAVVPTIICLMALLTTKVRE